MDMARKFLQMGWTRSRRYANHKSGRKYDESCGKIAPFENDADKAESARIFKVHYDEVRTDAEYLEMKQAWINKSRAESNHGC